MSDHNPDEYLPVEFAGNVAGIPPRTLRSWVRVGKLPATEGQRGKLVRLGDVLAIAEATGRLPATQRHRAGSAGKPATSADDLAGNDADAADPDRAISPAARSQLEAIRDEWLAPLVARNEELARALGRAEAERDELRRRVADLEAEHLDASVSPQDGPRATEAPVTTDEPLNRFQKWWRKLWGGA